MHRFLIRAVVLAFVLLVPATAQAATCDDYPNQAAAQSAGDTRDPDGDGVFCETLACPCLGPRGGERQPERSSPRRECVRRRRVISVSFSATRYPNIRRHFLDALGRGWPRTLVLNRDGADARRERLLRDYDTRSGMDLDEYPPAVGRGRGPGLTRGLDPRGWKADVRAVDSSENRSHGARMGTKLRRYCDGTRFRYVFY